MAARPLPVRLRVDGLEFLVAPGGEEPSIASPTVLALLTRTGAVITAQAAAGVLVVHLLRMPAHSPAVDAGEAAAVVRRLDASLGP